MKTKQFIAIIFVIASLSTLMQGAGYESDEEDWAHLTQGEPSNKKLGYNSSGNNSDEEDEENWTPLKQGEMPNKKLGYNSSGNNPDEEDEESWAPCVKQEEKFNKELENFKKNYLDETKGFNYQDLDTLETFVSTHITSKEKVEDFFNFLDKIVKTEDMTKEQMNRLYLAAPYIYCLSKANNNSYLFEHKAFKTFEDLAKQTTEKINEPASQDYILMAPLIIQSIQRFLPHIIKETDRAKLPSNVIKALDESIDLLCCKQKFSTPLIAFLCISGYALALGIFIIETMQKKELKQSDEQPNTEQKPDEQPNTDNFPVVVE